jgi:hypothetical protein
MCNMGFVKYKKANAHTLATTTALENGCSDMRSLQEELTDCSVARLITQSVVQTQKVLI